MPSLTGKLLAVLLVGCLAVAMAAALLLWNRVPGPPAVRWPIRVALLVLCQTTAVCNVLVYVNDSYGLYTSWRDLLGSLAPPAVARQAPPEAQAALEPDGGGRQRITFRGAASGVSGEVLVWLPPEYREARFRDRRFPVVELLHGVPGSPATLFTNGAVDHEVASLVAAGTAPPTVLVAPVIDPTGRNTDCTDIGRDRIATWLVDDVPAMLRHRFRVRPPGRGWGLMGVSTGGLCAAKLVLQDPHAFAAAAALSPDALDGEPTVLRNRRVRDLNSPLWLLRHRRPSPPVALMLATTHSDRWSPLREVRAARAAAVAPTRVEAYVLPDGGHNWGSWRRMYAAVVPWLLRAMG